MRPSAAAVACAAAATRVGVGDVDLAHIGALPQRRRGSVQRARIAVPQADSSAARLQPLRDREADAGRAAADDGDLAIEVQSIHCCAPVLARRES